MIGLQLCDFVLNNASRHSLLRVALETLSRFISWIPVQYVFETSVRRCAMYAWRCWRACASTVTVCVFAAARNLVLEIFAESILSTARYRGMHHCVYQCYAIPRILVPLALIATFINVGVSAWGNLRAAQVFCWLMHAQAACLEFRVAL